MIKQELFQHQKVVYQVLENALNKQTLGHAYLFVGEKGTPTKECAYLLIQSLLCEHANPFACEVCADCERVMHQNYSDMIYIDGNDKSIKKEDILHIQHQFNQTNLEKKGKKVYILDGVENATITALNALLKFLEEPQNDTIAILIASSKERVIETISSRCQIIQFHQHDTKELYDEIKDDYDLLNAYLLSKLCSNKEQVKNLYEEEEFQHACIVFETFLEKIKISKALAGVYLQNEGFKKSKKDEKKIFKYFLFMLESALRDSYRMDNNKLTHIWGKNAQFMVQLNREKLLQNVVECKDKIIRSVNILLLVDQFIYLWED